MDFILLVLVAIALAMNAFPVSTSSGIIIKDFKLKHALTSILKIRIFTLQKFILN